MAAEDAMPSLLAALRADSRLVSPGCSVCHWIEDQPNADEWDEAFAADDITAVALFRAMKARDFAFSVGPIHVHRQAKHRVD